MPKSKQDICNPEDVALKSLFLGPQSENGDWFVAEVRRIVEHTIGWRRSRYPADGRAISAGDQNDDSFLKLRARLETSLNELLGRLERETPKFTPRYIGHMVSENSLPALLAEFAMLLHNPNNASPEVAKVSARIETESIADLARMLGFDSSHSRGHFTSGGTLANFEAVWRALHRIDQNLALALCLIDRGVLNISNYYATAHSSKMQFEQLLLAHTLRFEDLEPYSVLNRGHCNVKVPAGLTGKNLSPVVLVPGNKHYSWQKAVLMFGLGLDSFWSIELDAEGRLDIESLEARIAQARAEGRPILMVVSVAGTTEMGEVDPVDRVQDTLEQVKDLSLWHHVDGAYGGFFAATLRSAGKVPSSGLATKLAPNIRKAIEAFARVSSITIDPHKLGYIPYACGAFIARDQEHYECRQVTAPYLKSGVSAVDWATTIEGSRSAAGAAAVWLTSRALGFDSDGLGRVLDKTIEARELFANELSRVKGVCLAQPSDTNVLCFSLANPKEPLAMVNQRALQLFERIESGPEFSVSRTTLGQRDYNLFIARFCKLNSILNDGSDLLLLRLVLMNPFICSKEMDTDFARDFAKILGAKVTESAL